MKIDDWNEVKVGMKCTFKVNSEGDINPEYYRPGETQIGIVTAVTPTLPYPVEVNAGHGDILLNPDEIISLDPVWCKAHPRYKAHHAPRPTEKHPVGCANCWSKYRAAVGPSD